MKERFSEEVAYNKLFDHLQWNVVGVICGLLEKASRSFEPWDEKRTI